MTNQVQTDTQIAQSDKSKDEPLGTIVSPQYMQGETSVQKNVLEMVANVIQKQLNRFLLYFITTILVGGFFASWTINSRVSNLEGKFSSPDKTIEAISSRLELLEKSNKELIEKNHQLEIDNLKLELSQKKQVP